MSGKQQQLFKTRIVPGKPGSGKLFEEEFVTNDGPVECLGMTFENDEKRREYFLEKLREKLKDPEFRKIEGFPIGEDEDILALSDPPYYTACPNPWIADFIKEWEKEKEPRINTDERGSEEENLCESVSISGSKKWVPFSKLGARKAVLNDLSPAATFIAYNYNTPVDVTAFERETKRILKEVEEECGWMYETNHRLTRINTDDTNNKNPSSSVSICGSKNGKINYTVWSDVFICPECAGEVVFWEVAVDKEAGKVNKEFPCSHCQAQLTKRKIERAWTTKFDSALKKTIKQAKQVPVLINYTVSGAHGRFKKGGTKPILTGFQSGTLYISSMPVEKNILEAILNIKVSLFSKSLDPIRCNFPVETSSMTTTQEKDNSIDYLFIDPPFGANLNYSELNFLWEAWLKVFTNNKPEAIENSVQKKGPAEYRQLMTACFKEAYRVLKPGRWMTVEFSNTKASVWNNIQTALSEAGFIIANVSALDKKQGSFNAVTNTTSVKQDLVISAYKPNGGFEERFLNEASTEEGVWDFVRTHLLREFREYEEYKKKRLKVFRIEAVRAGFKKAWQERDYGTIIAVASKIPDKILQEDPKLLMWYDQAVTRQGEEI